MEELKNWMYDEQNRSIMLQVATNEIQLVMDGLNSSIIGIRSTNTVTLNYKFLGNVSLYRNTCLYKVDFKMGKMMFIMY